MDKAFRVIGIDPGSLKTGYGIIDVKKNNFELVDHGVIKLKGDFNDRIKKIYKELRVVLLRAKPDVFSIERVFVSKNVDSALKLGHARAAAICACADLDLSVFEYSPKEIKKAVSGSGNADKNQVMRMVSIILNTRNALSSDDADALAIAICHANHAQNIIG
jgi:crossover junction endodeoxyribonuclease RuvC